MSNAELAVAEVKLLEVRPDRVSKTGRKLKAVMARWQGKALVIDATGRLANKKEFAIVNPELSKSQALAAYAEAGKAFNEWGEAKLACEQSLVAKGERQLTQLHENPETGVITIKTSRKDKATEQIKRLVAKGYTKEEATDIIADLLG